MSDHALTKMVSGFYGELNVKCNFKTRINHQDLPERINNLIQQLSEETLKRYYGSGIIIPENVKAARVLDVGSGSGSLVFILSKLVGPTGYVVGIDICPGLIETAKQESANQVAKWGYDKPNFEFHLANAERLLDLGLEPFDLVVSNGVFCLIPDKEKAFRAVAGLLKPGGQFYINDVYTQTKLPEELKNNEKLWSLGTTGAMIWSDLKDTVAKEGFTTPYLTQVAGVDIKNEEYKKLLNNAEFACAAWRLFKLGPEAKRSPATVTYKGNIEDYEEAFPWDVDLTFKESSEHRWFGLLDESVTSFSCNHLQQGVTTSVIISGCPLTFTKSSSHRNDPCRQSVSVKKLKVRSAWYLVTLPVAFIDLILIGSTCGSGAYTDNDATLTGEMSSVTSKMVNPIINKI